MRKLLLVASTLLWTPAFLQANLVYDVSLDTSPLIGSAAGPFSIDFQMIDGSGLSDGNNTVGVSSLDFGAGGSASGTPTLIGGATGDLFSAVSMTDSSFFNEFTQGFTPGSVLNFEISFSANVDSGAPDTFSFAIEDSTGTPLPTQAISSLGTDTFLFFQIDSANPTVQTFAADTTRAPAAGGDPIHIATPSASPVGSSSSPEPSSGELLCIGIGLAFLFRAARRFWNRPGWRSAYFTVTARRIAR